MVTRNDVKQKLETDLTAYIQTNEVFREGDVVTCDLSALEKRLDMYREKNEANHEKEKSSSNNDPENNPFSKPAKIGKKSRKKLLKSIFNNADKIEAAENAENQTRRAGQKHQPAHAGVGQRAGRSEPVARRPDALQRQRRRRGRQARLSGAGGLECAGSQHGTREADH